ncbi:substrate-binding domain-containing protein [Streptomyces phaeochromogenes]
MTPHCGLRRQRQHCVRALAAVQRAGLHAPEDLSIVGYNDIPLATRPEVPLTIVRVPFDAIAAAAVDQLIHLIAGVPTSAWSFALTLIPRRTTARTAGLQAATPNRHPSPSTTAR